MLYPRPSSIIFSCFWTGLFVLSTIALSAQTESPIQIAGHIYIDANYNGSREAGEASGVAGISLLAYGPGRQVYGPVLSNASGRFTLEVPATALPLRLQYQLPAGMLPSHAKQKPQRVIMRAGERYDLGIMYAEDGQLDWMLAPETAHSD